MTVSCVGHPAYFIKLNKDLRLMWVSAPRLLTTKFYKNYANGN